MPVHKIDFFTVSARTSRQYGTIQNNHSRIENTKYSFTLETQISIADALQIPLRNLLTFKYSFELVISLLLVYVVHTVFEIPHPT